ncbi:MAG: glycosyltransferase, partial [Candidatus Nitrotoga sp.]
GEYFIVFYGTYIPLQGIEYILRAFALLPMRERFHLVMVGKGQVYDEMVKLCDELKLEDVEFIPRMEYGALLALVKHADLALGIFGNTEKAKRVIPNKLQEPMALGVPVVMGKNAPSERYFKDGEHLYFCEMGNAESLAHAIIHAYDARLDRERITRNARGVIAQEFSTDKLSDRIRAHLRDW